MAHRAELEECGLDVAADVARGVHLDDEGAKAVEGGQACAVERVVACRRRRRAEHGVEVRRMPLGERDELERVGDEPLTSGQVRGALLGGAELVVEQREALERERADHALAAAEEVRRGGMREARAAGDLPKAHVVHALLAGELLHRAQQRGPTGRAGVAVRSPRSGPGRCPAQVGRPLAVSVITPPIRTRGLTLSSDASVSC